MQIHEIKEFAVAEHVKKVAVIENQHAAELEALQQRIGELEQEAAADRHDPHDDPSLPEYLVPVRTRNCPTYHDTAYQTHSTLIVIVADYTRGKLYQCVYRNWAPMRLEARLEAVTDYALWLLDLHCRLGSLVHVPVLALNSCCNVVS